ncbi:uncharacterized protein LOC142318205 [Lycorma delicatula]|uniref:uncharacterized protein LOC142318205 n=1 Tax=Lycorma delicatula TaxID=130591 RepID=UPI003F5109E4
MQKKKQLIIEAQEEFREYFENKRKEQEEKLKLERQDNINILKEIQTEKENAWKEAERKKTLVKEDVRQNRKMIEEYLEQKRLEEEEEDSAIKIHAATKKKIALIRKKKEQEMQNAAQERRNKIAMKLSNDEADRNAKEDAILQKAIEEKEALNEADISNKIAYKERLVNELKKERKAFLDREEQQRLTKKEEAKWNLMQRLKQTEENDKFYKKKLIEKINKMQENRAMWDKQCEERAIAASEEREQDYNAVKRAVQWWEDEDKEFLAYADRVLEDSKKKGRPLLPILKQVEIYKKENNLIRPLPQHEIWKSHIPINSVTKQTQTSNIPEKSKNSQTLIKPIDNTNLNTHDQGKRNIVRKPSLGFKQHTKKPVEPWPKCNEVCILPPKNRNGIQNSQK